MNYVLKDKKEKLFYDEMPQKRYLKKIINASLQNPFVSQFFSVLVSLNAFENTHNAPVELIICADLYKVTEILRKRGDVSIIDEKILLSIALRDSLFAAHSMVMQADCHGINAMYNPLILDRVKEIRRQWDTPDKVVPFVSLVLGYPVKRKPRHVCFPKGFIFFEGEYPAAKNFLIDELEDYLDNGSDLIEYYKKIDESGEASEDKKAWDWTDLLHSNCRHWVKSIKEFNKILLECGVNQIIT